MTSSNILSSSKMKYRKHIAVITLLVARVWSILFLLMLAGALGMHIFGALFGSGEEHEVVLDSIKSIVVFLCYPVGILIGLASAWKWEGLGGLIATSAIICLFIIRPGMIHELWIVGMGIVGLMFLIYWILSRDLISPAEKRAKKRLKTTRSDLVIAIIIILSPLALFIFLWFQAQQ